MSFLRSIFALFAEPAPVPADGYSISGMIAAMKGKDANLYGEVGKLSVPDAWRRWQEVYPEDFPAGAASIPGPDCIKPRAQP